MNSRPTPYQGVALPLRYSGSVQSGQRPKAAAIAYDFALGKGALAAMSSKASEREKRRAVALRANLKRRKAAVRAHPGLQMRDPSELGQKMPPDGPNKTPKPS